MDVEAELAAYEERACTGKRGYGAKGARDAAGRMRARYPGALISPYPCPFCEWWHVGHAPGLATIEAAAALLRARSGNEPGVPGHGTTRRQRRKASRAG